MAEIGVLLGGCGAKDGSEIHESVITLLALDKAEAMIKIIAPDSPQVDVINHINGSKMNEERNILVESSRIARGDIISIDSKISDQIDALILPGGTGTASNIFNYNSSGINFDILEEVENLVCQIIKSGKPIGAICIAPVMIAKTLQKLGLSGNLTGGYNEKIINDIEAMGSKTEKVGPTEIVVDKVNKIVSTPAYVEAKSIKEVARGIEKLVDKIMEMLRA
tara:strand:+ start:78202 stop:78867 length:666 start_codon:yes stop_codon:yes gene_type:complete